MEIDVSRRADEVEISLRKPREDKNREEMEKANHFSERNNMANGTTIYRQRNATYIGWDY